MNTPAPTLYIHEASLSLNERPLFHNLSFTLPSRSITCLLGSSGIGKTSLIRLMMNLPFIGEEKYRLHDLPHELRHKNKLNTPETAIKRTKKIGAHLHYQLHLTTSDDLPIQGRIAYMAQSDLLLPWMTVIDNVLLGTMLRHERIDDNKRQQAALLLSELNLPASSFQQYPKALSGGMKQRVALARTLMEDKPVIFMDEPFSSLDAVTRFDLQTLMVKTMQDKTVFIITHDPWEALRIADRILVLRHHPATLSQVYQPENKPPRTLDAPHLLDLYQTLLLELREA